MPRAVRNHPT
jgi:hypothetical protein